MQLLQRVLGTYAWGNVHFETGAGRMIKDLACLLMCVYFEHNPLVEACVVEGHVDGEPAYRHRLKELLPTLTQIDATSVSAPFRGR